MSIMAQSSLVPHWGLGFCPVQELSRGRELSAWVRGWKRSKIFVLKGLSQILIIELEAWKDLRVSINPHLTSPRRWMEWSAESIHGERKRKSKVLLPPQAKASLLIAKAGTDELLTWAGAVSTLDGWFCTRVYPAGGLFLITTEDQ